MKKVPVLITFDVDPAPHLEKAIEKAVSLLRSLSIPATFFFAAEPATDLMIARVLEAGHEVGCHGFSHSASEEFNKLSEEGQKKILTKATTKLEVLANRPIESFRAPRVKISAATLRILEELGYRVDSSVCSQRLDFLSSNLINLGWLKAPRMPYHPSADSPYKRGGLGILEVPVSALLLPFVSTALRIFGVAFMKFLFKLLYWESRITGKPIVYLAHPHEFLYSEKTPFRWQMLVPDRSWKIYGSPLRRWLSRQHLGEEVYKMNEELLRAIARAKNIRFMTAKQFRKSCS